ALAEWKLAHVTPHPVRGYPRLRCPLGGETQKVGIQVETHNLQAVARQMHRVPTVAAGHVEHALIRREVEELDGPLGLARPAGRFGGENREVVRPVDTSLLVPVDLRALSHAFIPAITSVNSPRGATFSKWPSASSVVPRITSSNFFVS